MGVVLVLLGHWTVDYWGLGTPITVLGILVGLGGITRLANRVDHLYRNHREN